VNGPTENTTPQFAAPAAPAIVNNSLNRSKAMQLMHEDMARAHSALRLEELLRHERSRRVVAAHRAQRRAERSVARAQRLLALASVR
jgi:hypothetical protein